MLLQAAEQNPSSIMVSDVLRSIPGLDIDLPDASGRTCLSWTVSQDNHHAIARLLSCGADPSAHDRCHITPLHWSMCLNDCTSAELLLNAKADVNARDKLGQSVLHHLVTQHHDLTLTSKYLRMSIAHGVNIGGTDRSGWTSLHSAVSYDYVSLASCFLEAGAWVNVQDLGDNAPLHTTIRVNAHSAIHLLSQCPMTKYDIRTKQNWTILHYATFLADIETLKILKSLNLYCIDIEAADRNGASASLVASNHLLQEYEWICGKLPVANQLGWYEAWMKLEAGFLGGRSEPMSVSANRGKCPYEGRLVQSFLSP